GEEEVDAGEEARELAPRLRDGLADLERQRVGERLGARDGERAKTPEGLAARRERGGGPRRLRGAREPVRRRDRRAVGLGDLAQDLAGGGVDDTHGRSA